MIMLLGAMLLFPHAGNAAELPSAVSVDACLAGGELLKQNELEKAIEQFTLCLNVAELSDPVRAGVLISRGNAYRISGQAELALADFTGAIALDPTNAVAYNNRGNMLKSAARYREAIADFTKAIELSPRNTMVYNNRGNAYKGMGQYDKAVADLDKAIELNPANAVSYYNRACLESVRKDTAAACEWLGKAMEKGFDEKELIRADKDLDNIRGAACYEKLLR